MNLVSKNALCKLKTYEADRLPNGLPKDSLVISVDYIWERAYGLKEYFEKGLMVRVRCKTCARQHNLPDRYFDVDKLLEKSVPANNPICSTMLCVIADEVLQLSALSEFKCYACGTKNIVN